MSANDSSFEASIGTWTAITNGHTPLQTNTVALSGNEALKVEATSSGLMVYGTASGTSGVPVTAGQEYAALAAVLAATSTRNCTLSIFWYQASGAASAITPSNSGSAVSDETLSGGGWTQITVTAAAPGDAAFAQVRVQVGGTNAASEVHYLDQVGLFAVSAASMLPLWSLGGYSGAGGHATCYDEFQFSTDGGSTWNDLRFGGELTIAADGTATCADYETTCGVYPSYNVLSAGDADFENLGGDWTTNSANLGGTTDQLSTDFANTGQYSLKVTAAGGQPTCIVVQGIYTGEVNAFALVNDEFAINLAPNLPLGGQALVTPVSAGAAYIARMAVRGAPGIAASTVAVGLLFYTADGLQLGAGPTSGAPVPVPTTGGWAQLSIQAEAPTNAAAVAIVVTWSAVTGNLTTGAAIYIDTVALGYNPNYPAAPTLPGAWTPGYEADADPALPMAMTQSLYRVRCVDNTNPALPAPSAWSNIAAATPQPSTGARWFISDPTVQGSGVVFDMNTDWRPTLHEEATLYYPIGRDHGVKGTTGGKGIGGQIDALAITSEQWNRLSAVLGNTNTLMLQTPFRMFYVLLNNQDRIGVGTYQIAGRADFANFRQTFYCIEADRP